MDPVVALLYTEGGSSVSFADIIGGYSAIKGDFKSQSRGAKDVCAQVFYEFHPVTLLTLVGRFLFEILRGKCHDVRKVFSNFVFQSNTSNDL